MLVRSPPSNPSTWTFISSPSRLGESPTKATLRRHLSPLNGIGEHTVGRRNPLQIDKTIIGQMHILHTDSMRLRTGKTQLRICRVAVAVHHQLVVNIESDAVGLAVVAEIRSTGGDRHKARGPRMLRTYPPPQAEPTRQSTALRMPSMESPRRRYAVPVEIDSRVDPHHFRRARKLQIVEVFALQPHGLERGIRSQVGRGNGRGVPSARIEPGA